MGQQWHGLLSKEVSEKQALLLVFILKDINPEYSLVGLMLKLKLQYLGYPNVKTRLIGKDPEEKVAEDEMVKQHHWLNGPELEQTPEDSEGQGSLACCSPWGHKESHVT